VIQVEKESIFQVHSVLIMDWKIKHLRNRSIEHVKVQWTWYDLEDATWDLEDAIRVEYPHLFEDFGNLVCNM
jgi:hypothetical protein